MEDSFDSDFEGDDPIKAKIEPIPIHKPISVPPDLDFQRIIGSYQNGWLSSSTIDIYCSLIKSSIQTSLFNPTKRDRLLPNERK